MRPRTESDPRRLAILVAAAAATSLLLGCRAPTAIVFVEGTEVALDATASTQDQSLVRFNLGYRRDMVALLPKKCVPNCKGQVEDDETASEGEATAEAEENATDEEALSMISNFSVRRENLFYVIRNNFASGRAAEAMAAASQQVDAPSAELQPRPGPPDGSAIGALMRPIEGRPRTKFLRDMRPNRESEPDSR